MTIPEILERKRDGHAHDKLQLELLIGGYVAGRVPDYQIAAWLMAVYLNGMTPLETALLTQVMAESGDTLDLSSLPRTVDKHSTGGVGDKTSLVLAPMLAACGLTVAKMSGRGLAHTGGTIDKLESIPGWNAQLEETEFLKQARDIGLVLVGQSKNLAPADGLLYALRDVTATVPSVALIASSIMSKKLASGSKTIVLDVKVGAGAFMRDREAARLLAQTMVGLGRDAGVRTVCLLTSMEAPLGRGVGNALEVAEAVEVLRGGGPPDLVEVCLAVATEMLALGGSSADPAAALADGRAHDLWRRMVAAQGGDPDAALPTASHTDVVQAPRSGWLSRLDALAVGTAAWRLGAGRARKEDAVDPAAGVVLGAGLGERVEAGQPLLVLHASCAGRLADGRAALDGAYDITDSPVATTPLVLEKVG